MEQNVHQADGYSVFHWPEFQALCKKLDINLDQRILSFTLRLQEGERPLVTLEVYGVENTGGSKER